jgi:hypothetical protein
VVVGLTPVDLFVNIENPPDPTPDVLDEPKVGVAVEPNPVIVVEPKVGVVVEPKADVPDGLPNIDLTKTRMRDS